VTLKIVTLAVVATLMIGALISVEMASGDDPALGPKATASTKKSTASPSGSGSSASSSGSGTDPYSQQYGNGYSYAPSGSSGYSQQSPAPVTSATS
jgi:hypothetical protein